MSFIRGLGGELFNLVTRMLEAQKTVEHHFHGNVMHIPGPSGRRRFPIGKLYNPILWGYNHVYSSRGDKF